MSLFVYREIPVDENSAQFKFDGFAKSQNLAPSRKERKGNLFKLNDIFLAFLASLRENRVITSSSPIDGLIIVTKSFLKSLLPSLFKGRKHPSFQKRGMGRFCSPCQFYFETINIWTAGAPVRSCILERCGEEQRDQQIRGIGVDKFVRVGEDRGGWRLQE